MTSVRCAAAWLEQKHATTLWNSMDIPAPEPTQHFSTQHVQFESFSTWSPSGIFSMFMTTIMIVLHANDITRVLLALLERPRQIRESSWCNIKQSCPVE